MKIKHIVALATIAVSSFAHAGQLDRLESMTIPYRVEALTYQDDGYEHISDRAYVPENLYPSAHPVLNARKRGAKVMPS
ncbi:hypothetical protein PQR71_07730 [Paraburkholderia fungorum]|uniref:hypothetical protein n=1 Tax=Paraburkholderia fungorum TaxID=134537 RepID=UPI0038BA5D43